MLEAFDTNINADSGALATKYGLTAAELMRVDQGHLVWQWFLEALTVARFWTISLTQERDRMETAAAGPTHPLPGGPTLPPVPDLPGPPPAPVMLEPGFFAFFGDLVARIKKHADYEVADGVLLGIEGSQIPTPDPTIVPALSAEVFTSGQPELSCKKGPFQGYNVWLTRPAQARREIGFSSARRFMVEEPLPAAGTAEVWTFEVQYRYQNAPFGQVSQPYNLTVRG